MTLDDMVVSPLDRVRRIALALPGVTEHRTHGAVGFYVEGRRALCYLHDDHRGDGRVSVWFPASGALQEELVTAEPDRFFRPVPSAAGTFATWLGLYVDLPEAEDRVWAEVSAILHETYRSVAPRRLVAKLDDP